MRFSVTALSALLVPSAALSFFNGESQRGITSNDDLKIPGESPLEHCPGREGNGYVEIKRVDLLPNPPAAGRDLIIKATGNVNKTIEDGAYIDLVVKYGLIRLLKTRIDLCEQMGEVQLKCPLERGERVITKTVKLPKEIPPGTYNVEADVFTAGQDRITCLTATVKFNVPGTDLFGAEL
ncbi:phosphatidylglycerol/phosphatidylinositol transfer protein precursor [Metarhizium album ARSEF 1941]|uniref:Phosphatidylglycerol/phosphatidylinositol transfer protein n=1 Tax=Metarhizium album (strain ARSEF 1941) TaxID=1081103 RepID=A0A0B2WQY4_METAS|nr:phosphatidylglycerol/phosphatidylinositol transfer protein precursor [Metarhizium album ARSEF 1941]KHN96039.1 phosphatidylglycerol/phosphatidylinositol transfer protein precursor [Metarhizium album ARSEF 1941]